MRIKEIIDKNEWNGFLEKITEKTFLDSWEWGEFQVGSGFKIWRLGVVDNGALKAVALIVKIKARRGIFLMLQHGPVIADSDADAKKEIFNVLLGEIKNIGKTEQASFVRMNPLWERTGENEKILKDSGLREAPMHINAYEATWKLDINPSEDELMKGMRKTTRYLIRQAQKNPDITIEKSPRREEIDIYGELNEEVARRQKFVAFKKEYIGREFDTFAKNGQVLWFIGRYDGKPAAASLVIFWSGVGFYHQAASRAEFSKYSIPYLLQWEAIKEAKARGCQIYDFWGFNDPKVNPNHPWAGPTLFKMGFGGKAYEYVKAHDLPLSWRYWPTFLFEKLRSIKRGL